MITFRFQIFRFSQRSSSGLLGTLALAFILLFTGAAHAEINVTYHLDSISSPPPGEFTARVLLTGPDAVGSAEPKILPSAYFDSVLIAKDTSRAAVLSKQNDQIIYSYLFKARGDLSLGAYQLPQVALRLGKKESLITWPPVQISAAPEQQKLPFRLVQEVSTTTPYVGEQIVYTVRATSPINSRKNDLNVVELSDFWSEEFGNSSMERRQFGSVPALVGERKRALFPLRAGKFWIPARSVSMEVLSVPDSPPATPQTGPRGRNADLAFDPRVILDQAKSKIPNVESVVRRMSVGGFELTAKALPPKPFDAQGYVPVGTFQIVFHVDTSRTASGETVVALLEIEGDGNLRPYELISPRTTEDFDIFLGEPKLVVREVHGQILQKKSYEIVLVPKRSGDLRLPSFEVHTFNPRTGSFEKFVSEVRVFHITSPSHGAVVANLSNTNLSAQKILLATGGMVPPDSLAVILLVPPMCLALLGLYPLLSSSSQSKRLRLLALPRAKEVLKGDAPDPRRFSEALALYALAWTGNEQKLALTWQESIERLRPYCPLADKTIDDLSTFFRDLERSQYNQGGAPQMVPETKRLLDLLSRLHETIRPEPSRKS